jgi:class 3 adenylate cyclase/tetratricopeptide (TPR) repeat protein
MNCPTCQTLNRQDANFCKHCATLLTAGCPRCQSPVQEQARFCDACALPFGPTPLTGEFWSPPLTAEKISAPDLPGSKSSLHDLMPAGLAAKLDEARQTGNVDGERRIVTILFCDIKGSTAAAELMDPEDWSEIINEAFEVMIRPVYQYEGTVARLMGDAILAFFGAPIAHEDDPRRAILAGLEIVADFSDLRQRVKARWDLDLNVRVGINTGLVLVGNVGSDLQVEYTALGDAINLAARMEQGAQPGTVQVAENTHRRTAPLFEFEDLGKQMVKGKGEPVHTYRPLHPKAEPGRQRGIAGLDAPMIGRDSEWVQIRGAVESLRRGIGHIVFLSGEAGLGKSRMIREMESREGADLQFLHSAALSFETVQPFGLFQRLFRRTFGGRPDDSPAVVRELIGSALETVAADQRADQQKAFESLFGLTGEDGTAPLEAEGFKKQFFATVVDYWRQRAADNPLILVFDDVHWADPASIELLEHLLDLTSEAPLLMVLATRPERESGAWSLRQQIEARFTHQATFVQIKPLSEEESGQLVDSLLTISDLPQDLRRRILARADGNPFYVEEVVRSLIDSEAVVQDPTGTHWVAQGDGAEIDVPESIQALIIARIDRLEDQVRRTLQMAAMIGRSFYFRVLSQIATHEMPEQLPDHLLRLQQMDLIREAARHPELEYIFRHVLTQEAAYKTVLRRERHLFHARIGEVIAALFKDNLEEHAAVLAYHFSEGGEHERAAIHFLSAGKQAMRLAAYREAVSHFSSALDCLKQLSDPPVEQQLDAYRGLGRAYELVWDHAAADQVYIEMQTEAEAIGDSNMELAALLARSTIYNTFTPMLNPEMGETLATQTLELAKTLADAESQARVYWILMLMRGFVQGHLPAAVENGELALALCREHGIDDLLALTINDLGRFYCILGEFQRGLPMVDEAEKLFEASGNWPMLSDNLNGRGVLLVPKGDFDDAIHYAERALALSKSINNSFGIRDATWRFLLIDIEQGNFKHGVAGLTELLQDLLDNHNATLAIANAGILVRAHIALGDLDLAWDIGSPYLAQLEQGVLLFTAPFMAEMALLALQRGDVAQAEQLLQGYERLSAYPDFAKAPYVNIILVAQLSLALQRGQVEDVIREGQLYLEIFKARGQRLLWAEIAELLARAHLESSVPDPDAAETVLKQAYDVAVTIELHPMIWRLAVRLARLSSDQDRERWLDRAAESVHYVLEHSSDTQTRPFRRLVEELAPELTVRAGG